MFKSIQDLSDTYAYNSVYKLVYIVVKSKIITYLNEINFRGD